MLKVESCDPTKYIFVLKMTDIGCNARFWMIPVPSTYLEIDMTVGGDTGWKAARSHVCDRGYTLWKKDGYANKIHGEWSIHLFNSGEEHVCGWMRISDVYPTHLSGDIDAWRTTLNAELDVLWAALVEEQMRAIERIGPKS